MKIGKSKSLRTKFPCEIPARFMTKLKITFSVSLLSCLFLVQLSNAEIQPTLTWDEFDRQAQLLAPSVSVLAAELTSGSCEKVHSFNGDVTTPIGSTFKLYILAELASQIGQGKHRNDSRWEWENFSGNAGKHRYRPRGPLKWGKLLKIRPEFKSVPGGPLLFVPDGSIYSFRYLVEQMMQVSDNTATDHMLFLAGRENVERRMVQTGHQNPSLNIPLWGTREMVITKFLWSDEQLQEYEQASVRKRRHLLAAEHRGWPALEAFFEANGDQTNPVRLESVEWFANRFDICELLLSIHKMGQQPKLRPLLEVLALHDPVGFDREKWTYVGFKGGSEIGLQAGNWLVQRADGRLFFFSVVFFDPDRALDLANIIPLFEAAPDILFSTP